MIFLIFNAFINELKHRIGITQLLVSAVIQSHFNTVFSGTPVFNR